MAGPPDSQAASTQAVAGVGHGQLRASHADRERAVDKLKSAFVAGELTKPEFDTRIGRALASRTYAELARVTAIKPRPTPGRPAHSAAAPSAPARLAPRRVSSARRWGSSGFVIPAILATGFALASAGGGVQYEIVSFVVALGYFLFWLSAGADLLWQYHCGSMPSAKMCVRCGHTEVSHRASSCQVRDGSVEMWRRCACVGYVQPGRLPGPAPRGRDTGLSATIQGRTVHSSHG